MKTQTILRMLSLTLLLTLLGSVAMAQTSEEKKAMEHYRASPRCVDLARQALEQIK